MNNLTNIHQVQHCACCLGVNTQASSFLTSLPAEIIVQIMENVSTVKDLSAIMRTCHYLLDIGYNLVPAKAIWRICDKSEHVLSKKVSGSRIHEGESDIQRSSTCLKLKTWIITRKYRSMLRHLARQTCRCGHRVRYYESVLDSDLNCGTQLKMLQRYELSHGQENVDSKSQDHDSQHSTKAQRKESLEAETNKSSLDTNNTDPPTFLLILIFAIVINATYIISDYLTWYVTQTTL